MAFDFANVNEKIGKLPIWGWGLLIGGGIVGAYYFRNKNNQVPNGTATASADTAASGNYTSSDNAAISGYSGNPAVYSPDAYLTATPSIGTDVQVVTPDNAYTTQTPNVPGYIVTPPNNSDIVPAPGYGTFSGIGGSGAKATAADPGSVSVDTGSGASNSGQTMPGYDPTQFGTTGGYSTTATPTTTTGNAAATLDAWRLMAISKAAQNSSLSNTYWTNAVDKYLAGLPLDKTQAAGVNKALNSLGNAPGTSLAVKIGQTAAASVATPTAAANSAPANSVTPKSPKVLAV